MLCDRCALNAGCKHFQPKGQCLLEKRAFDRVVSELTDELTKRNDGRKLKLLSITVRAQKTSGEIQ